MMIIDCIDIESDSFTIQRRRKELDKNAESLSENKEWGTLPDEIILSKAFKQSGASLFFIA